MSTMTGLQGGPWSLHAPSLLFCAVLLLGEFLFRPTDPRIASSTARLTAAGRGLSRHQSGKCWPTSRNGAAPGASDEKMIRIAATDPPAMYPDENKTPGLVSPSSGVRRATRSARYRAAPPRKTGTEVASGRYTPTAKGSADTPASCMTM